MPEDLREIAFAKSFDLHAGTAAAPPPDVLRAQTGGGDTSASTTQTGEDGAGGDALGRIATRLGISRVTVEEVFNAHDGDIELVVSPGKLSGATATATKEIALLVSAGRQAAGLEEWTSWDQVRDVCKDFRKLDSGNFAKTMREMDDVFNTRKQSERKLLVRLAKPGWERAADAVRRLGGE